MNIIVLLMLLAALFTSLFVIIPAFAPADQQDIIKDWLGIGFSGFLLLISLFESRFSDGSLLTPVLFYLFVLTFLLSGIYGWIPAFIPKNKQSDTIKYMFLSTTVSIILVNSYSSYNKSIQEPVIGGRRRR